MGTCSVRVGWCSVPETARTFIEFNGPYADGENNDGIVFSFETKNHVQSRKYLERCIKDLVKYADNVYDLAGSGHRGKLTLEQFQKYAVKKANIRISGSQWEGVYYYRVAYSKNGKYFTFSGRYEVYNNHERANCLIGFYPLSL